MNPSSTSFWLNKPGITWKVYLKTSEVVGTITYEDDAGKKMVEMAFNAFYPAFKEAQEAQGKEVMSEEESPARLGSSHPLALTFFGC